MPSNYKRKSNQQSWDKVSMKRAIDAVKYKNISYNKAAKCFNVPRSTLKRRVEDVNIDAMGNKKKILGRFRSDFTEDQEQEIVNYLLDMEKRFYGLTINNIQTLAYELTEKNNISHNFNVTKTCKRQKKQNKSKNPPNTNDEDSDAECPYCGGIFSQSKSNEGWVRCLKCMIWCHDACAGCEGDSFICDFCKTLSKAY